MADGEGYGAGDFKVGDEVLVRGNKKGTVAFVGETSFGEGAWLGVVTEKPIGRNDGKVEGVRYFKAKANHGLFVRPHRAKPFSAEEEAAGMIESAVRRHAAHKAVDSEMNTVIYNTLDNDDEHEHIERLGKLRAAGMATGRELAEAAGPDPALKDDALAAVAVEDTYEGPHLKFPLTLDNVMEALDKFKHSEKLHYKYTMQLLKEVKALLGARPTLMRVPIPDDGKFTIVGDTHGQLQDLFSIFTINDIPSETNHYLFNGDFVDRGKYGVEVCLSMFMFALLYPGSVHFNRGNHEERSQNETAGFMQEVLSKYRDSADRARGRRVYDLFEEVFDALPLATVVADTIFVVHGGLFDRKGIKLAHVEAVHRKREIPLVRERFEDGVFQDMLWSDPRSIKGSAKNDRGAGVFWGPNLTANFCKTNGIELIVRSHECVPQGYKFHHGNRVLTLFSASRYMGTYSNKGAILVLKPGLKKNLQQFIAHSMGAVDLRSPEDRLAAQEEEVLTMVIERVVEHKHELMFYFDNLDVDNTGKLTKLQWAEGMNSTLKLDLPWMRLAGRLVDSESDGSIKYAKFLHRYKIDIKRSEDMDTSWQSAVVDDVCRKLYEKTSDPATAYKYFDADSDGKVSYEEFVAGLKRMDLGLTSAQIYDLMSSVDSDLSAYIDYEEFAQRFKPVFTKDGSAASSVHKRLLAAVSTDIKGGETKEAPPLDSFSANAMRRIGEALLAAGSDPHEVFQAIDTSGDGLINGAEFETALKRVGLTFSEADLKKVMNVIDTNASGQINYLEFVGAFKIGDSGSGVKSKAPSEVDTTWQDLVVEQVISALYKYRLELNAVFTMFDLDGSGTVSREEFLKGMKALENVTESTLTEAQAERLMDSLDKNGDGELSYSEFFESFQIVDTKTGVGVKPPNQPQHTSPGESLTAAGGAGKK